MIEQVWEAWDVHDENSKIDKRLGLLVVLVNKRDFTSYDSHWIKNEEGIISEEGEEFAVLADIILVPDHLSTAPSNKHQVIPDLQRRLLWKDANHNKDARSNLQNCCDQVATYKLNNDVNNVQRHQKLNIAVILVDILLQRWLDERRSDKQQSNSPHNGLNCVIKRQVLLSKSHVSND